MAQLLAVVGVVLILLFTLYQLKAGNIRFKKDDANRSFYTLGIVALFLLLVLWICMKVLHINT